MIWRWKSPFYAVSWKLPALPWHGLKANAIQPRLP